MNELHGTEKNEMVSDALEILKRATHVAIRSSDSINKDVFNDALNTWTKYINKKGNIVHRCIHIPISLLGICKSYSNIATLKNEINNLYNKSLKSSCCYDRITSDNIYEYGEMTINFATKIYQAIYNKEI